MIKMGQNCLEIKTIEQFLNKNVRPYLASHNGNIEIVEFKEGILEVKLLGSCVNCPAAKETLNNRVIKLLEEEFSEIKDIKIVTGVSDDLLNQAKKILQKR